MYFKVDLKRNDHSKKMVDVNVNIVWYNIRNKRISEQETYGSHEIVYVPTGANYFRYKTFINDGGPEDEISDDEEERKVNRRFKCINCFILASTTPQTDLSRDRWESEYTNIYKNFGYICGVCKRGDIFTKIDGPCAGESDSDFIYEDDPERENEIFYVEQRSCPPSEARNSNLNL